LTKVLVLGSSGLLGSSISRALDSKFELIGTHFRNSTISSSNNIYFDVSSPGMLEKIIYNVGPQYVINCIGATSVEECELFPEKAMLLNAIFPYRVAKASRDFDFQFLHISTDHFSNPVGEIRDESMQPIPLNSYGYSKYVGERLVLNVNPKSLILRTNFFGVSTRGDHSLLDFAIKSFSGLTPIFGYEDVWFTPLGVNQIANFLASALESTHHGILNLSGTEAVTKLSFLREVARALGLDPNLVRAAKSSQFPSSVVRPLNLSLDNSKLLRLGVDLPSLKDMIREELSYRVVV
jgi:dTDP-4-dehydrorhamnose reductase